jgi:hypothetical protein
MERNEHKRYDCGKIETKIKEKVPYPHTKLWPKIVTKYIPLLEDHLYGPMRGRKIFKNKKLSHYLMFSENGLIVWSSSKC